MLHFVNLMCIVCYFDTFIHCNMTGTKAIFIPVHHHSTIVVSTFITLCIQSLFFIYFSLQVCTLKHHESYPLTIHSLVTTILLLFFFKNKLDFLRFHMLCDNSTTLVFLLSYLTQHKVLKVHLYCQKWQNILSHG